MVAPPRSAARLPPPRRLLRWCLFSTRHASTLARRPWAASTLSFVSQPTFTTPHAAPHKKLHSTMQRRHAKLRTRSVCGPRSVLGCATGCLAGVRPGDLMMTIGNYCVQIKTPTPSRTSQSAQTRSDVAARSWPTVRKPPFLGRFLLAKTNHFPRQARDKRRRR